MSWRRIPPPYTKASSGLLLHLFAPPSGCCSGYRAASPSPAATAEEAEAAAAGTAVVGAAAAAAAGGFATQTPRAWCHASPSCWTSCTPPGSTSTRPGTSASCSWTSASSSACLNRTQRRSVGGGWGGGNPYPALMIAVGLKPANTNKNLITLTQSRLIDAASSSRML